VATGGLAPLVALENGAIDILNPDLTLIGLKIAYHQNIDAIQDRQAKKNAKR
jgi:pantothenate kinase type III